MSTLAVELHPHAHNVKCTETSIVVELVDGRTVTVPLIWFPRLSKATVGQAVFECVFNSREVTAKRRPCLNFG